MDEGREIFLTKFNNLNDQINARIHGHNPQVDQKYTENIVEQEILEKNSHSVNATINLENGKKMNVGDYLIAFSDQTKSYCVGIVDMVDSTKISSKLSIGKISRYYQIFLNTMAKTLSHFGGMVIKNVGDSLVFYFPESSRCRRFGFMCCLEASLAMIDAHDLVCECAKKEDLPCINYRISCDYGPVAIMKPNGDSSLDMIGPPLNMCSKINHLVKSNEAVIGGDLYQMVKKFDDYKFQQIKGFSIGLKYEYPAYLVTKK